MLVKKISHLAVISLLSLCVSCSNNPGANQNKVAKKDSSNEGLPFYLKKPDYDRAAELNVQLGYGYLKQKNYSRAKSKFIYALELQPKLAEAHAGIAKYYHIVGENNQAVPHYLDAIKYSKHRAEHRHNYAIFLCDIGDIDKAKEYFLEAISEKTYEGVAISYQSLGGCMQSNNRLDEAENYYKAALRHDPYQTGTVLELSKIARVKKQYEAAWNYFVQFKNNNQLDAGALLHGAKLSADLGDMDTAASLGLVLKSRYRDSFEYKQYLGISNKNK